MLKEQKSIMITSYYRHIRDLIIQLSVTDLQTTNAERTEKLIEKLEVLHNKLLLTDLMADRSLLAITGLQGVGKTTIIKKLYDLPDEILPENSSRGERLPVFITEKDITSVKTFVYRAVPNGSQQLFVQREEIDVETFKAISMEPTPKRDLWLECYVPQRYFKSDDKSIVLLPGFEKDESDISQLLLEHILYLSTSSVLVLRKDTFARETTQQMMRKVKQIYKSVKPVMAISFGNINPDQNAGFKQQMIEEFDIQKGEESRVVITGIGPDFTEDWETDFINAINDYCYTSRTSDDMETRLLFSLMRQVDELLVEAQQLVGAKFKQYKLEQHLAINERQDVIFQFEMIYNKYLEDLEKQIAGSLAERQDAARQMLRGYLEDNSSTFKELKIKFFGQKPKEFYALENKLQQIWENPNMPTLVLDVNEEKPSTYLPPNLEILKVVSEYVSEKGQKIIEAFEEPAIKQANEGEKLSKLQIALQKKSVQKNVQTTALANPLEKINQYFDKNNQKPVSLVKSDYETLTVMGTLLVRESFIAQDPTQLGKGTIDVSLLEKATGNLDLAQNMERLSNIAPKVLKSVPIILGFDGLVDGELDLANNAANALNAVGISITAPQLLAVLGGSFAVAFAAKAIQDSIRKANERQLQLAQVGEKIFAELPQIQAKAFVSSLRRVYERMAEQLLHRHLELKGTFDEIGQLEQIQYTMRMMTKISNEIKKEKYERSLFL